MDTPDYITIPLGKKYSAIVDHIDADLITTSWHVLSSLYPYARAHFDYDPETQKTVSKLMHRVIMERVLGRELSESEYIDHVNGDCSDNRRSNLRLANKSENNWNAKIRKDNKYGMKGVSPIGNRWRARIRVNKKEIALGCFGTKEEASEAYKKAAKMYFGEFARSE